jgi:hypothetical protein
VRIFCRDAENFFSSLALHEEEAFRSDYAMFCDADDDGLQQGCCLGERLSVVFCAAIDASTGVNGVGDGRFPQRTSDVCVSIFMAGRG